MCYALYWLVNIWNRRERQRDTERTSKKIDCRAIWIHSYLRDCCWCRCRRHRRRRYYASVVVFVDFFFIVSHHQRLIHVRARSHSYLIAKLKRIISLTTHTHTHFYSFVFHSLSHSLSIYLSQNGYMHYHYSYNETNIKKSILCVWIEMEQRSISVYNIQMCCSNNKIDWKYSSVCFICCCVYLMLNLLVDFYASREKLEKKKV